MITEDHYSLIKSSVADRSVPDPTTLSDLERRHARGQFLRQMSVITLIPFDL